MLIDPSGRGPTMRQLYVAGIAMFLVVALLLTLLMLRYAGVFEKNVPVTAVMKTVGDGLQDKADVKYRGVLVGEVDGVTTVENGTFQHVNIHLNPEYAGSIPSNVTARTVPSNVFAVNSIEFIAPENPSPEPLQEGDEIQQDDSAETVALQTTLTDVREILTAIQPERLGHILAALSGGLDRVLSVIDTGTPNGEDVLSRTSNAMAALNQSAPELITMLESTIETSMTLVEKQAQFENLLFAGVFTMDSTNDLFARNPNLGIELTHSAATTFGALASDQASMRVSIPAFNNALQGILGSFKNKPYYGQPYSNLLTNISFTPFYPYARVHCPRYGDLMGPSCYKAPIKADPGHLPKEMWPRALDDNMPPGGSGAPGFKHPFELELPGPPPPVKPFKEYGPEKKDAPKPNPPLPVPPLPRYEPTKPDHKPADKPASATTPASATVPAGSYTGPAAIAALLGRAPSTLEYLLLETALQGGVLEFSPAEEGAV